MAFATLHKKRLNNSSAFMSIYVSGVPEHTGMKAVRNRILPWWSFSRQRITASPDVHNARYSTATCRYSEIQCNPQIVSPSIGKYEPA